MTPDRRTFLGSVGSVAALWGASLEAEEPAPTMPADRARELPTTQANLGTLAAEVNALAGSAEFPGSFLSGNFATFESFRTAGRATLRDALGPEPPRVEPRVEVLDRVETRAYVREKLVFSTTPELRVPAYLFLPKGVDRPAPAIVDLHSHGGMFLFGKEKVIDFGGNHPTMVDYHARNYEGRPTATALAERGYVVIVIDALMFGERRILLDDDRRLGWDRTRYSVDDVRHLNMICRGKESTIVKGLTLAGRTWPGIVAWDDSRTIDYLVTRPEVDPRRIGCLGVSLGGYRSLLLSALDERIAAACVVGFMSTVRPMIRAHLDTHSFVHFIPQLHRALDLPDVVTLRAPRPLLVQQCRQDGLFPLAGMEASLEKIASVYRRARAESQFTGRFYDLPHRFSQAMQDDAFAFLDQHLRTRG